MAGGATAERAVAAQRAGQGPPPPPPPGQGHPAAATVALAATAAAVAAAAAAPPVVGLPGVAGATTRSLNAINVAAAGIIGAFERFLAGRREQEGAHVDELLSTDAPEMTADERFRLVDREMQAEKAFAAKTRARLDRDLPKALVIADQGERESAVHAILDRERRIQAQREDAVTVRALGAADKATVKAASPEGAYWRLSPTVKTHTLDCLAMGGKVWPWSVLDVFHPPLCGPWCQCELLTIQEAVAAGLVHPGTFQSADQAVAIMHIHECAVDLVELDEQLALLEVAWRDWLHPRNRLGRWRDSHSAVRAEVARSSAPPAPTANPAPARAFSDLGEARGWAREHFAGWQANLTAEQTHALAVYKHDEQQRYRQINRALRGRDAWTADARKYAPLVQEALSGHPLTEPLTVYRALPITDLPPWPIEPGHEIVELAFMSTSLVASVPLTHYGDRRDEPVLLELALPAGTPAGFLDYIRHETRDAEILLPAGAVVRVQSVHVSADQTKRVVATVIRGDAPPQLRGDQA